MNGNKQVAALIEKVEIDFSVNSTYVVSAGKLEVLKMPPSG